MPYTLDNAEQRAARYPASFELPSADDRKGLRPGDYAKCIFLAAVAPVPPTSPLAGDRMWIQVKRREGDRYVGILTNEPTVVDAHQGDEITFGPEHVIAIEPVS